MRLPLIRGAHALAFSAWNPPFDRHALDVSSKQSFLHPLRDRFETDLAEGTSRETA